MGQLTVTFQGVCAHYRKVVPDVLHRVVLPDASDFRAGHVRVTSEGEEHKYFLMPHYAKLTATTLGEQQQLNVDGAMHHGWIYAPMRVEVANASVQGLDYTNFDVLPRIETYVSGFKPSPEVVYGAGARCQFDFNRGLFTTAQVEDKAIAVVLTINTDGRPRLRITRPGTGEPETYLDSSGDIAALTVGNIGIECDSDTARYDFLLNFLTGEGGIPTTLTHPTPGMQPSSFGRTKSPSSVLPDWGDVSAACSNTGYP